MDDDRKHPTGIYQLQIAHIPAFTAIVLAFLTSNSPDASRYLESGGHDPAPPAFINFGDGRFQYSSGNKIETRDVFVPLRFDRRLRKITSMPSPGEHGKWTISIRYTN